MAEEENTKKTGRGGARPNSGGKRQGAGRKAILPAQKRVSFPSRVAPETLAAIKADAQEGENVGKVVDRWAKSGHQTGKEKSKNASH